MRLFGRKQPTPQSVFAGGLLVNPKQCFEDNLSTTVEKYNLPLSQSFPRKKVVVALNLTLSLRVKFQFQVHFQIQNLLPATIIIIICPVFSVHPSGNANSSYFSACDHTTIIVTGLLRNWSFASVELSPFFFSPFSFQGSASNFWHIVSNVLLTVKKDYY